MTSAAPARARRSRRPRRRSRPTAAWSRSRRRASRRAPRAAPRRRAPRARRARATAGTARSRAATRRRRDAVSEVGGVRPRRPDSAPSSSRQSADEHQRQHRRGRCVEAELVLGVDLGRERAEAQQREGAVLGQQVQRDDQAAAEQREAQLRQRHAPEDREGAQPEAARDVLERRVGAPQRGDRRQHDERVVRERRDEHGAPEAVDAVVQRDPGVAVDELGHGERQHEQDRPEAAARHVGALDAARRRRRRRSRRAASRARRARACCAAAPRRAAAQEVERLRPAGAGGLHADERERQQQHRADRQREQPQRCGTEATPPSQRCRADRAQRAHR